MKRLWTEKYRPNVIKDYVWRDVTQKKQVEQWIKEQSMPHVLLSGSPGVGKTTLARILVNELHIDPNDVLELNSGKARGIDIIRTKVIGFASTVPFGRIKVVILDEADALTQDSQEALRGVLETYENNCRFILTCNYPNKIIPALHSRCQGFHINKIDLVEFTARCATILVQENVEFDLDTLDTYVRAAYPDLRKCINNLDAGAVGNKLMVPDLLDSSTEDFKIQAVELLKKKKLYEARQVICQNVRSDEIDEMFRWCYDNLELWGSTQDQQDQAIIIIRNGIVNHSMVADPEINLSATLCELCMIA